MDRKRRRPDEQQYKSIRKRPRAAEDRRDSLDKKRPRYSERRRADSEHAVDTVYAEYHNSEGHFRYVLGESVGDVVDSNDSSRRRYKLLSVLGQGTFGLVLEAWDRVEAKYVAIKIVRAIKKYTESAKIEIDILTKIQRGLADNASDKRSCTEEENFNFSSEESEGKAPKKATKKKLRNDIPPHSCIKLDSWFMFKGHVIMVFEKFGLSLFDFMEQNAFRPFELKTIIHVAYEIFSTLYHLHEGLELIHTDLKPENILFIHDQTTEKPYPPDRPNINNKSTTTPKKTRAYIVPYLPDIKVIDLGSAVFESEHHGSVISTRHYRAPEVLLQTGWSYPADIWSVGCILIELFTGQTLFHTHKNLEHLAMMQAVLGPIPDKFLETWNGPISEGEQESRRQRLARAEISKYFSRRERNGKVTHELRYPCSETSNASIEEVNSLLPLSQILDSKNHPEFYDLIKRTMTYDPKNRITAKEALDHPFFDSVRGKYKVRKMEERREKELTVAEY
eukprot:TRINITY_DN5329_c0_g1_i2.p1 TRINITY_DN5329_c0_g1~~TRINITY_DN5329_c0_g1_i2.p1  ORF type:complete len:506 (-),score=80.10 TRINITY_DN5329_c0_g1_i2:709-2226(-)